MRRSSRRAPSRSCGPSRAGCGKGAERRRDVDEVGRVRRPGLDQQDPHVAVLAQAVGEHAAGRAGADDHVVVHHSTLAGRAPEAKLSFRAVMAVPKQRQSHSRTNKRRSQHKIEAPGLRYCRAATLRAGRTACANCGTYAGREVVVQQRGVDSADE